MFRYEIQNGGYDRTYFNIGPYGENVSKCFFSETTWTIETKHNIEVEKPPTGIFEKPKLKSARSLRQDMDDLSSNDSDIKHRVEMPTLRNTPAKIIVGNGLI